MENGLEEHKSGSQETGHKGIGVVHTRSDGGLRGSGDRERQLQREQFKDDG